MDRWGGESPEEEEDMEPVLMRLGGIESDGELGCDGRCCWDPPPILFRRRTAIMLLLLDGWIKVLLPLYCLLGSMFVCRFVCFVEVKREGNGGKLRGIGKFEMLCLCWFYVLSVL